MKTKNVQSEWIKSNVKNASSIRDKEREFHGLEREFINHQDRMLRDFKESSQLKHPRDLGNSRENILRSFLEDSGLLPRKYAVSRMSSRVISPSGHFSNELDLVIYDAQSSVSLMRRQNVYEAFAKESVYGVVQVKSILTKAELIKGLDNVSSYKKLNKYGAPSGFGILFAYETDMDWSDIVKAYEEYANTNPKANLTNAIVVLSKGVFLYGTKNQPQFKNIQIESLDEIHMHGCPDHSGTCLFMFYEILMESLRSMRTMDVNYHQYYRLPLISGDYSYEFAMGPTAEMYSCKKHGLIGKRIKSDYLNKIMEYVLKVEPLNWIKAIDIAYGKPGDNVEQYKRQPEETRIYNPENLPLSQILLMDSKLSGGTVKSLAYDSIICNRMQVWIPYYYSNKYEIMEPCKKCLSESKKRKTA